MTDYRIDVFDDTGAKQAILDDFRTLAYTKRRNHPGLLTFSAYGEKPIYSLIDKNWQYELWRKPNDGTWGRELAALHRYGRHDYSETAVFTTQAPGILKLLDWRVVAWFAGTADRTKFIGQKAETIAKTLVRYNITADATTVNGRCRNGTAWPATQITVEADTAGGNTLDWFCAFDNLLETLQKLAEVGGGDFDLVKTSPTSYEFRWYAGQLGTDRSATVKFALNLGNMAAPVWEESWMEEATVAIVGGQNEGADREIEIRTGVDYAAGNDIEMFVAATDVDTAAGLQARGDQALVEAQAKRRFEFKILQTPACLYGKHYFVGDLVTGVNPMTGVGETLIVDGVAVGLEEDGKETVSVEVMRR